MKTRNQSKRLIQKVISSPYQKDCSSKELSEKYYSMVKDCHLEDIILSMDEDEQLENFVYYFMKPCGINIKRKLKWKSGTSQESYIDMFLQFARETDDDRIAMFVSQITSSSARNTLKYAMIISKIMRWVMNHESPIIRRPDLLMFVSMCMIPCLQYFHGAREKVYSSWSLFQERVSKTIKFESIKHTERFVKDSARVHLVLYLLNKFDYRSDEYVRQIKNTIAGMDIIVNNGIRESLMHCVRKSNYERIENNKSILN